MAKKQKAPDHFSAELKSWFEFYTDEFEMAPADRVILEMMGDSWLEYRGLRLELAKAGSFTFTDRHGSPKPMPHLAAMNSLKVIYARLLRELNLPVDEPDESRIPRAGRVA